MYGELRFKVSDLINDISAAEMLINTLENVGATHYLWADVYGAGRGLRVNGISSEKLAELYDGFDAAIKAVEKEVTNVETI